MAHRITVTSLWTAVVAALVALLASLGFGAKAAPAAASVVPTAPAASRRAAAAVRRPVRPMGRRSWRAMMRGGSLPPTIKQRIRAEAHGKAPSVRRSTTAASLVGNVAGAGREEVALVA
ncbi:MULTISPECIES: DUF6344 domain-containing protein [unclassified Streptomyces]|uniref:DUF6344 domain-containing protein n=1 Tax=unclassified Streptomyces TaxID=2593676 RepID=UPI002E0F1E07|nr:MULTISPECIES: DUF6344 domain-containing protein [unclassified Streptomyces]WSR26867.1 DUF6344 domain-containing protein [Streptomyces sp. NBC_01205]